MKISEQTLVTYRQATIFFLATFLAALWTTTLNNSEFNPAEIKLFTSYLGSVFLVQLLLVVSLMQLRQFMRVFDYLASGVAAVFTAFNVYTLVLVHNTRFSSLDTPAFTVFIAGLLLVLSLPYFIKNRVFIKFVHIFGAIMALIITVQAIADTELSVSALFEKVPEHFRSVKFEKKPNIYLISFDALIPEAVAKDIIGVEKVGYPEMVKRYGGRLIPNTFAERIPTKRSLNLSLAMDLKYYDNVKENAGFIRDQTPNPAYEILRDNGYKIQFLYKTSYFGDDKGRLDYYGVAQSKGLCMHVDKNYSFMGYCLKSIQDKIHHFTKLKQEPYPELLFKRIKETAQSNDPWFTYSYIYSPGHASLSMDYRNEKERQKYRKKFIRNEAKLLEKMEALLKIIKTEDPDSITIIFGDHGAMLSTGLLDDYGGITADAIATGSEKMPNDSPLNFKQIVQDRHAVFHALLPAGACPDSFVETPYSTMRIIRDLFICLSGTDPLPEDYQPDDSRWTPYMYE